ncbi:MAG: PadR family transcriptional regulator [Gemmatimonadota bacterium]
MSDHSIDLNPKTFHILVVLAARPLHGYAIRHEVEERTAGAIRLWPATLYGALAELAEGGLIEETAQPEDEPADDRGRRWYALTAHGRRALAAEAARLEELAGLARARLGLGEAT